MTPDERARMRDTLRAALRQSLLPGATADHPGAFVPPPSTDADLAARFRTEMIAVGGAVHEASSAAEVASIVLTLAAAQPTRTVLIWDDEALPLAGVGTAIEGAGMTLLRPRPGDLDSAATRQSLAAASIGITGATAALAETGSIVLVSGPGRPRLASLLPPVHVALVRKDSLLPSFAALVAREPGLLATGSNVVCITGPSRTADIEHTLSRGVHGPKEVHVIFV